MEAQQPSDNPKPTPTPAESVPGRSEQVSVRLSAALPAA